MGPRWGLGNERSFNRSLCGKEMLIPIVQMDKCWEILDGIVVRGFELKGSLILEGQKEKYGRTQIKLQAFFFLLISKHSQDILAQNDLWWACS